MASTCPMDSASNLGEGLLPKGRKGSFRARKQAAAPRAGQPNSPTPSYASSSGSSPPGELTVFDGVAIIAGTAIGGGFLALPSLTTPMGFLPAATGLFVSWAFLALSALAYAEATLRSIVMQSAARAADAGLAEAAVDEPPECSVLTVTRCSLGDGCSTLCSAAFAALMFVLMTAQVVKCGELLSVLSGAPYVICCLLPSVATGLFSFCASTRSVEQANSLLTVALVVGFATLIFNTAASGGSGTEIATVTNRLSFADWRWLLPTGPSWALPVFINLISFGQTVPVVVVRFGPGRADAIRSSIVLGSFIPFVLCTLWAAVSAALLDPKAKEDVAMDPVLRMLLGRLAVALPVGMVAAGAIGTSLISNYLSLGQFVTDGIFAVSGRCTRSSRQASRVAVVVLPVMLACGGPQLYLPLLAFAGAYPTNFLFGLVPCLACLALRKGAQGDEPKARRGCSLQVFPGGRPLLMTLACLASALLLVSAACAWGWLA